MEFWLQLLYDNNAYRTSIFENQQSETAQQEKLLRYGCKSSIFVKNHSGTGYN